MRCRRSRLSGKSFDGPNPRDAMQLVMELRKRDVEFGGEEHSGWLPAGAATPQPTPREIVKLDFEIQAVDGGYLLTWAGPERRHCGDTWHASVEEAMEQANQWFGVQPQEWSSS